MGTWCGGFLYEPIFKKFLFSWDISENSFCLPENDKKRLRSCLLDDLGIDWAENAEIYKHDDEKTIRIAKNENAVEIRIDEQEEKATLVCGVRCIDLKVKRKDDKLKIFYLEFPHAQVWRVLATIIVVILGLLLCIKSELIMIGKPFDHLAICFLWLLILYLSLILWLPFHNIWECIERIDYAALNQEEFRQQMRTRLNVVSTLVAFSIAFVVLCMSISFTTPPFSNGELNVFKLVMGLLVVGVIFLVVTLEAYDTSVIPAFDSTQIERVYLKGWWYYTLGLYSIVVALLLYVYLLEPLITIIGVILFIVAFTYYLRTPCAIKSGYQNGRIDK